MARTLNVEIVGDAKGVNRAFGQVGAAARGMSSKVAAAGRIAATAIAGIGVAAVGVAAKGLSEFNDFSKGMSEVFTLLPGISGEAMDKMSDQVKAFSSEFGVLTDDAIPALYQAISAGVPPDNVFEFLEVAQKAAKGGVTELETAVDGISSVVNAYGSDVISATQASDLMFIALKLGKTDFDQLSRSLFNVIPTAASLGIEFGEVTAGLAALTAQGVPTTVATTQLRQMFVELGKAGGETANLFEDLAGQSFPEFIASGGGVSDALRLLAQHADESGIRIADLFGSVEAGAAAAALASGDFEAFQAAIDAMGESAGATDAAFQVMDGTMQSTIDKLKAKLEVLFIEIGEQLAPIALAALELLEAAFPKIIAAAAAVKDWIVGNWPAVRDTILDVYEAVEGFVTSVWPTVESATIAVFDGVRTWVDANWPAVRDKVLETYSDVESWVEQNWPKVRDDTIAAFDEARTWVESNWPAFRDQAVSVYQQTVDKIGEASDEFKIIWDRVWPELVPTALGALRAVQIGGSAIGAAMLLFWDSWGAELNQIWKRWWDDLPDIVTGSLLVVLSTFQMFFGFVTLDWNLFWTGLKNQFEGLWTVISTVLVNAFLSMVDIFQGLQNAVNTVMEGIKTGVVTAWSSIPGLLDGATMLIQKGVDLMIGLKNGIETGFTEVTAWFIALPVRITDFFSSASDWLISNGKAVIGGLASGIVLGAVEIWEWFGGVEDRIVAVFDGARGWLVEAGKEIVRGIWDGVSSMSSWLTDKIGGFVGGMVNSVLGTLGIKSPSTVFRGIGINIMKGLALGIEEWVPKVIAAVENAMQAVTAAATPTGTATLGTPDLGAPVINADGTIRGYSLSPSGTAKMAQFYPGTVVHGNSGFGGLAEGGLVKARPGGLFTRIAEGGQDEAVIPLHRLEAMMGGRGTVINIANLTLPNVHDPESLIRDLQAWSRRNGPLPFNTAA